MKNVLIVDDERLIRTSLAEWLRLYDKTCNVLTAGNGREAVDILETALVDIVITDLDMPVMDGLELLAYRQEHCSDVPAIVITSFVDSDIRERLFRLGACTYMPKPFGFKELHTKILQLLEARIHPYDICRGSLGYANAMIEEDMIC
ncbi:MAG: response regulator [Nitrospirota bacterium]